MDLEQFDCVLFDMDGTLIDTEPVGPDNFVQYFAKFGVEVKKQELELFTKIWRGQVSGYDQNQYILQIADKNNLEYQLEEFLKGFYQNYIKMIVEAKVLPGVDQILDQIAKSKSKIGLVTSSNREQVESILKMHNWSKYFDIIITKDDINHKKPNPEPYLIALNKLLADANKTVVFEDSRVGVKAGKAAGCFVVGVMIGSQNQDLSEADLVINDLIEIL